MRLLIICQYFPPDNQIGAVRPSRIAKYLSREGDMEVSILAAAPYGVESAETETMYERVQVTRVKRGPFSLLLRRGKGRARPSGQGAPGASGRPGFRARLIRRAFTLRLWLEEKELYWRARKLLASESAPYDAILSTYNTEFGHRVARAYKRKHPQTAWIADFRDSTWLTTSTRAQKRHGGRFARWVARSCDAITAIGEGILQTHSADFGNTPRHIVPNGFDPDDRANPAARKDGVFRLVYTGELYNGRRDISPVFRALEQLSREGRVDLSRVEVVYAGRSGEALQKQCAPYPRVRVKNAGFLPRAEALELQNSATLLLLSSWCTNGDKYTWTGKFFEYLSAKRPIVCTISGDATGSALKRAILDHHLGACCEEAGKEEDFQALQDYLQAQYARFVDTGEVFFEPDDAYIAQYNYESIARQMGEILRNAWGNGKKTATKGRVSF